MPKYTVPIVGPDGTAGTITVNASDASAAVDNASQGGNTATGAATLYEGADPASQDSGGGSKSSSTYNTDPVTTGATQGQKGTDYGYGGAGSGDSTTDRTKANYGYRTGEKLPDWMSRVFQQGTRDFGGTLSPDSSNPYSKTPYALWFQNQYQNVVPANQLLQMILGDTGGANDFAPNTQKSMEDFMAGGAGRGFGTGTAGAQGNLGKLNDLLNAVNAHPGTDPIPGMSSDQADSLRELNNNPSDVLAMFNAQLSGGQGANPLAARYIQQLGQQMLDEYYDDPVGHDPAKNGTFLQNLMKKTNMA